MKRNIILTYIFSFFFYFYIDLALWPIYLTNNKGFSIASLGILQAVLALCKLVFELPSGVICDKIGRVKTIILSTIFSIFSNFIMIYGQTLFSIIIAYMFFGISNAFISGTLEAFLYDSLKSNDKESHYKRINTNLYVLTMVSFVASMFLGGYISTINMSYMYVGNIVALIIALIFSTFMVEPEVCNRLTNSVGSIIQSSIVTLKTNSALVILIMFISITEVISNGTWHLSQKYLSQHGMSNIGVSYEAIFTTVLCAFAAKIGYYIEGKVGGYKSSVITTMLLVIPLIILGLTNNMFLLLTTLTFTTISISFARPFFSSYINDEVESSNRATVLSIGNFISGIFALIYAGILDASKDIGFSFVAVGVISIPIYIYVLNKIRKVTT